MNYITMEKLEQYYKVLNQTFLEKYALIVPGYDKEAIHEMRVSIKKIKALFLFFEFCNKRFSYKKAYMDYKLVFRKTGIIRDLQIHQEHLSNWQEKKKTDFGDYGKMLKYREIENQVAFSYLHERIQTNIFEKSGMVSLLRNTNIKKHVTSYIKETLKSISAFDILQVSSFDEIHEFRKILKELQYNLASFQYSMPEIKINKIFLRNLKSFTEILGLWHDNFMLLCHLYDYKKTYVRHVLPKNDPVSALERKYYRNNFYFFKKIDLKHKGFLANAEYLRKIYS